MIHLSDVNILVDLLMSRWFETADDEVKCPCNYTCLLNELKRPIYHEKWVETSKPIPLYTWYKTGLLHNQNNSHGINLSCDVWLLFFLKFVSQTEKNPCQDTLNMLWMYFVLYIKWKIFHKTEKKQRKFNRQVIKIKMKCYYIQMKNYNWKNHSIIEIELLSKLKI